MDGKYAQQFGRMKTAEQQLQEPPADYDDGADETSMMLPSIRDNEYMQHSTLWGSQYMSGMTTIERFFFPESI